MSNAQLNKARPNILSTLNGIIAYVPIVIRVAAVILPLKQQMLFPREKHDEPLANSIIRHVLCATGYASALPAEGLQLGFE